MGKGRRYGGSSTRGPAERSPGALASRRQARYRWRKEEKRKPRSSEAFLDVRQSAGWRRRINLLQGAAIVLGEGAFSCFFWYII